MTKEELKTTIRSAFNSGLAVSEIRNIVENELHVIRLETKDREYFKV